ncbi:uncharacterized protein P174DRAFT_445099 [Aspergillus novofumigatus IBT 16806]|uniref:Uncharacterized protein n=1 Tax=Aspergillus novofumigatus (strain IBT 16806) TaxID=1392255 RepID=A0A2I1BXK9_ASPN1|nr:uncharacterized protein P174DRAFT_445099 [Aspergillus novofumigatus IBT 16806]PKX90108.1 hypothetical protein P174DRAFT_445099 [Aspergillus novofumigatus IBT 16806]
MPANHKEKKMSKMAVEGTIAVLRELTRDREIRGSKVTVFLRLLTDNTLNTIRI